MGPQGLEPYGLSIYVLSGVNIIPLVTVNYSNLSIYYSIT